MSAYDPGRDSYYHDDHLAPSSAFSTTSSEHERPGTFIRRMFAHASKGRAHDEYYSHGLRTSKSMSQMSTKKLSPPEFILTPSPNTHPLLSKPSARVERRLRPTRSFSHQPHTGKVDVVTHARQEAERALESRQRQALSSRGRSSTVYSSQCYSPTLSDPPQDLYTRNLRDRERIAAEAALSGQYVREWGFFVKCYAEGRFNMSTPPDPPPRRPDFIHLVAPAPTNERQRLQAAKTCNISLPLSSRQKCEKLAQLACTVFQTRMASISIIDEHHEVVKADFDFGCRYIDRNESIAAHVLLANEPMVVLDTEQDWRFHGNPLVANEPYIRFYAGAPIVTHEGHTIGVFAVFDTQPRTSFPTASRQKLMDFGRLFMTEIETAMEQQALPLVPKPSTMRALNKMNANDSVSDTDSIVSHRRKLSAQILKAMEEDARKIDEAYPAGEASEILPEFPTHPAARPLPRKKHIPIQIPIIAEPFEDDDMATPPLTPCRPFSVSSLSSCFSAAPSNSEFSPTPTPRNSMVSMCPSSNPDDTQSAQSSLYICPSPITSVSEAAFATSLIARSLSYDLVYLLRVTVDNNPPDSPLVPRNPNAAPRQIRTRVLVSHGLPDPPPIFDADLHLRALRSLGGLIYQNPVKDRYSSEDTVGYQVGILLPLAKHDTGGIVLAAFSVDEQEKFKSEEVRFLKEFGEAMKDILMKADPEAGSGPSTQGWL